MRRMVVAIAALLLTVSACASGSAAAGNGGTGTGAHPPAQVRLGTAQNGRTVTVATGGRVVVRLDSTYWQLHAPSGAALKLEHATTRPVRGGIPGLGRGTVEAVYTAGSPGTVMIVATRKTCGEAMRCSPPQQRWAVTVHVRG